jgi:hypothetical protein
MVYQHGRPRTTTSRSSPQGRPREQAAPLFKPEEEAQAQPSVAALAALLTAVLSEAQLTAVVTEAQLTARLPAPEGQAAKEEQQTASSAGQLDVDTPTAAAAKSTADAQSRHASAFRPYWAAACSRQPSPRVPAPTRPASAAAPSLQLARACSLQSQRIVPATPVPACGQPPAAPEPPGSFLVKRKRAVEEPKEAGAAKNQKRRLGPSRLQLKWATQVYAEHYSMQQRGEQGAKGGMVLSAALAIIEEQLLCAHMGWA